MQVREGQSHSASFLGNPDKEVEVLGYYALPSLQPSPCATTFQGGARREETFIEEIAVSRIGH